MDSTLRADRNKFNPGSSGVLASGRLFRTRALLWAAALFLLVLGSLFASVLAANWLGLRKDWSYIPPIVIPALACCVYALLVRRFERRKPWEFAVDFGTLSEAATGFLFGSIFITSMWALLWGLGLYTIHRGVWTHWFQVLVFNSYISAVLEELAFRGVLLRIFSRMWGARTAVLLSSLLFGLAHFSHGSWLGMVGIIVNAGVTLALLYVITGRLWMSIGMHLGYDFVETSVLGVGSKHGFFHSMARPDAAAWLTGGTFGPDAAIPGILLGIVINVILWRVAFRRRPAGRVDEVSSDGI